MLYGGRMCNDDRERQQQQQQLHTTKSDPLQISNEHESKRLQNQPSAETEQEQQLYVKGTQS